MSDKPTTPQVAVVPLVFTHFPLPYKNPGTRYERVYPEGTMVLNSANGVPYGKAGRSLMSLVTTQAILQGSREVELGHVTEAFRRMGQAVTGGTSGSVARISDQFQRLYSLIIGLELRVNRDGFEAFRGKQMLVAEGMELYWSAKDKDLLTPGLFQNKVLLSNTFFDYVKENSVPVDLLTYHGFQSAVDQDFYAWLSRKLYAAKKTDKESFVPWSALYLQFGPVLQNNQSRFRKDFQDLVLSILTRHPEIRVKTSAEGVTIVPSTLIIEEDRKGFVQT